MRNHSAGPWQWLSDETLRAMVRDLDDASEKLGTGVALEPIAVRDERHWLYVWHVLLVNELHARALARFTERFTSTAPSTTPDHRG